VGSRGISTGVAFIEQGILNSRFEAIISGQNAIPVYETWTVFASVPEVLCADVYDAVVLFDRSGWFATRKGQLEVYPSELRRSILDASSRELYAKATTADSALREGEVLVADCTIYSSLLPVVRGLFATEKVYFRGMKHLMSQLAHLLPAKADYILSFDSGSQLSRSEKIQALLLLAKEFRDMGNAHRERS
jgi:hypothetical protein